MIKIIFIILLMIFPKIILAKDITNDSIFKINNEVISEKVKDNNEKTYLKINKDETINIESNEEITSLYIVYELKSIKGKINYHSKEQLIGENNFLHEYILLNEKTKELSISYDDDVKIADIYAFSEGELPNFVEIWQPPCEMADLLLFSTHSDDEQLFFLGLLPTYVDRGASVEVVYFTNHYDNPKRLHEQLHGLYTVGIRNYPIIGIIPDAYSESLDGAIKNLEKANLTTEDAMQYEVEMIRRFKPLVIVGHDEAGEYSHGQHILNTYILKDAIKYANDNTYDEASIKEYGLWNPSKVYLHLYKENPLVMDYDTPLSSFDGKTAYEVSKMGYSKHLSQQWTWFTGWINGKNNEFTKSTDIKKYSPNEFGLYYTTVGYDEEKNDMFENLTLRKDIVTIDQESNKEEVKEDLKEKVNNNTKYNYIIIPILIITLIIIFIKKR